MEHFISLTEFIIIERSSQRDQNGMGCDDDDDRIFIYDCQSANFYKLLYYTELLNTYN